MDNKNNNTELTEDEFLKAIKEANLGNSLAQYVQKISDKRVSEGIKSYEDHRNKKDLNDSEKITNLETELKEMKDSTAKNSLNNSIKASLKEAGLSEGFAKYIKVDKEEDIGTAVKDLTDNILELKQLDLDNKLKGNLPPVKGEPGKGGDSDLDNYVESKNKGEDNSPFKGKI